VFILAMLALDLGVFHRKSHIVSLKESLTPLIDPKPLR
jgi:tellurite resistance protein TerC